MKVVKDLISIIIPIYNRQDFIEDCIQSVTAQSYQNFEIILIDDGSSDKTIEICTHLAENESRIKLFTTEHGGVSAARNKGLAEAAGEYVFFLDSDDAIHYSLLETLVSGMKNSDAAIAGTEVINISKNNWHKVKDKIKPNSDYGETSYQTHQESLQSIFSNRSPLSVIGGIMMRRDLIGETTFRTDLFIGEDFYFIYQNLIKGASTVFLKQKWYYCQIHKTNSSRDFSFAGFWTRFHRRELVWESEEALGRTEYSILQKRNAFTSFLLCIQHNKPYSDDAKKIRKVMKDYKKILLPALKPDQKIRYYLYIYIPFAKSVIYKLEKLLRNLKHSIKK